MRQAEILKNATDHQKQFLFVPAYIVSRCTNLLSIGGRWESHDLTQLEQWEEMGLLALKYTDRKPSPFVS